MNPYTLTLLRHGDNTLAPPHETALSQQGSDKMEQSWRQIISLAPVACMATSPSAPCRLFAVHHAVIAGVPLKVEPRFTECDERGAEKLESEAFQTRVLAGFSEWISASRGSHRVLVTHGQVITALLAELLGIELAVAKLVTVQPGGYVQLSILANHPAYMMRLDSPAI